MTTDNRTKGEAMSRKCPDCGGDLDHVGTRDGSSSYDHCWACWYRAHPQDQIREYKKGKR